MEPILKKLEARAGTVKRFVAFSIPITRAASETIRMKGYIILVSSIVRAAFSAGKPGARKPMNSAAKITPSNETRLIKIVVSVAILEASFHAEFSPSVAIRWENTVTKAVERAPSAKRSRSRLGARKAVKKASMPRPAPKSPAKMSSRSSPRTRLSMTAPATTPAARVFKPSLFKRSSLISLKSRRLDVRFHEWIHGLLGAVGP